MRNSKGILIEQVDLIDELKENWLDYSVAVNSGRAIPDAKSGLKPVITRALWSMYEHKMFSNKPYTKSARVVGNVMGQYHPHGDSAIYEAMIRIGQEWSLRYPLLDFHGNKGAITGDGAAAMRYTEVRLTKLAEEGLLKNLNKRNVPFNLNYDETLEEPAVLPTVFPNLLCNPTTGIGSAMATGWAPHNLRDVGRAIGEYLHGEPISPVYPDFPTGGLIINKDDIPKIMETGKGSVKIRARYTVEGNTLTFYEVPFGTTVEGILEDIKTESNEELLKKKKVKREPITGIKSAVDNSNRNGVRITVECEKGENPDLIALKLYSRTKLQNHFSYNQVAVLNQVPVRLNMEAAIKIYVEHNLDMIQRESTFDLDKAMAREEIVRGLLVAYEKIENIIAIIRGSEGRKEAKVALVEKYGFTDPQVEAILNMKLSSLARIDGIKLQKEQEELIEKISNLKKILSNKDKQVNILWTRLEGIVRKFGDDRRSELTQVAPLKEEREEVGIDAEDVIVTVSQSGCIKRTPKANFRVQKRNTKGVKSLDEAILDSISTNTIEDLLIFSSSGTMYKLKVNDIPEGTAAASGPHVSELTNMSKSEKVQAIATADESDENAFVVFVTKYGLLKKTLLTEYTSVKRKTGIKAIKLKEGDEIVSALVMNEEDMIVLTSKGMSIRFNTDTIRPLGRVTMGVKAIKLKEGDHVIAGVPVPEDESQKLVVVTEGGSGKRLEFDEFEPQNRGGIGCFYFNSGLPSGDIVDAVTATEEDSLLIAGKPNSVCISASELPVQGKTASGFKAINNSTILRVVRV